MISVSSTAILTMIIVDMGDPEELEELLDTRGYQDFVIQEAEVD
jgi:hypothetical protein